ncbi:MAG: hypothetical protein H7177_03895 [Rhizobacter sp.]|nr:hypothetical protein [Bacteriovorax sp.]
MLGIPPFFKEIFKYLPNALLDLISWREMLGEVTVLSNRLLTNKGALEAKIDAAKIVTPDIVLIDEFSGENLKFSHGEMILKLYFLQIMKGQKIFLDFRPKHFSGAENKIQWNPGGLWAEMDQEFSEGIRNVYRGYYNNDDQLFAQGMIESGLVKKEWDESKKSEVVEVFKKHFSNGRGEKIAFDMDVFKESFAQIFKTLVKNKIELDKNFLYLGIMLVTLYITLDQIGGSYDVSTLFHEAD